MKELLPVSLAGVAFGAIWSIAQGQDINWDFRNYYYYTVYAWLHDRVTFNIAPAQMQTWLNPLVFLPKYFLINHARPVVAGALFGAFEGISFALVYAIARCALRVESRKLAIGISLAAAIGGGTAPPFLEGLGRTSSDNPTAIFVLLGLLAILWAIRPGTSRARQSWGFAAAGLLIGMACGLKLTSQVYAIGLTASLLLLWARLRFSVRSFALYAAGGVAGFALTGGYWSYFLWKNYQNPILPYYNAAFHSDWVLRTNFRDDRFLPHSFAQAISYPFLWFTGDNIGGDSILRDPRFALLTILLPIVLLAILADWRSAANRETDRGAKSSRLADGNAFWLLLLFFVASYICWMKMFAILRYMVPLELLSSLTLFLLLDRILASAASKAAVFGFFVLFSAMWTVADNRERVPYDGDWFGVKLSPPVEEPNTLFVMAGGDATSYIIPFLPSTDRFVRINSNLPMEPDNKLFQAAEAAIGSHSGPLRSLTAGEVDALGRFQLARFGLEFDETNCATFASKADRFKSCTVRRNVRRPLLTATPQIKMLAWYTPGGASARVYLVEANGKRLFGNSPQGVAWPEWLIPGRRYVFELNEWAGSADGPLLARLTIREDGQMQEERFDPSSER